MKTSVRPPSQQGLPLQGFQTMSTPVGVGIARPSSYNQDKRYYVSAIQNHMIAINDEMNKLKRQLAENKLEATNYEECKRQAQQYATQLAEHEETLMLYNTAIETVMFKGSKTDIDSEAESVRASKQDKIHQLEMMYSEKLKLEENLAKVQQELEMVINSFI